MSINTQKITDLLKQIYSINQVDEIANTITEVMDRYCRQQAIQQTGPIKSFPITEQDSLLITYGDQFVQEGKTPLAVLHAFLQEYMQGLISGVHILPFFPYSSDDGFAVIDYEQVDPAKGSWADIADIRHDFNLMFDLVVNHISAQSIWFKKFQAGKKPYDEYFITLDTNDDLSAVIRPRTTPLLTPKETADGLKYVWTTFGIDQIDLNYQNPLVLLEMVKVLLFYVSRGANFIRLDAIAFLWKVPGSSCLHLPQTHAIVKLFRAILDEVAPQVLLITETNVPHEENISYFGALENNSQRTDEAQLVYQFPLAPLVLHSFINHNTIALSTWAAALPKLQPGTAFFNFIASHDGIGLRPIENLLSPSEIQTLVQQTLAHGGRVSYKINSDGIQTAYELNITWFDALNHPVEEPTEVSIARFLASQAIMLCMAGVPGIYIHSLFGSRNCYQCVQETGRERSINREKFRYQTIKAELENQNNLKAKVFNGYSHLLHVRRQQKAFNPMAEQDILQICSSVFCVLRTALDGERILCLVNVTDQICHLEIDSKQIGESMSDEWTDLLSKDVYPASEILQVSLHPFQSRWLLASRRL
jgi:sucrose phosphorylase